LDRHALVQSLRQLGTPGAQVRPVRFRPSFDKHAGQICHGAMLHVTDWRLFRPVATYLSLLAIARAQAPDQFQFVHTTYEFETDRAAFDLLTGSDAARQAIESGASPEEVASLVSPVDSSWRQIVIDAEQRLETARA
jgi:uncharacterized protein YbbC (DUF1343 family)